ncbi:VOC family protein [Candidatus Bipolaricaulota bacterium]|nr:VOC family protein [Candidatus Bipolaricaulota bacterium]
MSGIVFFGTNDLSRLKKFYTKRIGARIWKDQGDCIIFRKGDFCFAFCERGGKPETCGIITFIFDGREPVDKIYHRLVDIAEGEPESRVPNYNIYQFFGKDPEGRTLEFQCFLDGSE